MQSVSSLELVFLIIAVLAVIGVVVTFLRSRMTYSGYEEYQGDIHRLSLSLQGEIFRDGPDVVISGAWDKRPTVVRFSNQENTPGLNVRMAAPAFFQMSVAPSNVPVSEGPRTPIKTTDDNFDSRFTTRTDQPAHARLLITRQFTALLQKLACSKNTFLQIGSGTIELSELVVPYGPAQHVVEHLKQMASVAASLRALPGAEAVKVVTFERERHVAARIAMVAGIVVAVFSIVGAMQVRPRQVTGVNQSLSNGILPIDATLISNAAQWRAASVTDLDVEGVDQLRSYGVDAKGMVQADLTGDGANDDDAYLLLNAANQRRVVVIAAHQVRYDSQMSTLGLIARVPHDGIASIKWKNGDGPGAVKGDGVLIVRSGGDPESGVVLFVTPTGIASAAPEDWRAVPVS